MSLTSEVEKGEFVVHPTKDRIGYDSVFILLSPKTFKQFTYLKFSCESYDLIIDSLFRTKVDENKSRACALLSHTRGKPLRNQSLNHCTFYKKA